MSTGTSLLQIDLLCLHQVLYNLIRIYWTLVISTALGGKAYGNFYPQKVYHLVRAIKWTWQKSTSGRFIYRFTSLQQFFLHKWGSVNDTSTRDWFIQTGELMSLCCAWILFIIKSLSLSRLFGLLMSCFMRSSSTYHSRIFLSYNTGADEDPLLVNDMASSSSHPGPADILWSSDNQVHKSANFSSLSRGQLSRTQTQALFKDKVTGDIFVSAENYSSCPFIKE